VISADTRHNHELWEDFFNSEPIQIVLRIINMVLERLDPEFVKALRALKAAIQGKKGGKQFLMGNPCHLINLAVHYNQEGTRHTDSKSLHSGWDPMVAFGRYVGCKMKWPALETKFMVHPTDFTFGRGAGFMHQALEWRGGGRMVLVPFVDRRLFGYQSMARPQQFQPFYWKDQHGLKSAIPPKPLRWD
jgi:hypothetical protein